MSELANRHTRRRGLMPPPTSSFVLALALALGLPPALRAQAGSSRPEDTVPPAEPPPEDATGPETEAQVEEEAAKEVDPEIFNIALADFYDERYPEAAAGFWGYIHFGEGASAENTEWAQYFLAECLRKLGFWHAAVQYYYTVAKTRSRPEILPDALGRLEAISRRRPFSESLIFEDLVYDSEFGFLPPFLADWVQYVQGLYDYKNGLVEWAERHFNAIAKTSPYALKAMYVQAVYALQNNKDDAAIAMFDTIVSSSITSPEIKNQANLALARLLFDTKQYPEALKAYDKVVQNDLSFEQAELLLEKAWTFYLLGDRRKAMGLLHSLDAPSYEHYFLPDAYVLRGLILKDLCHFIPSKRVTRAFRFRYARAIDMLHRRVDMRKIGGILDAATQEGIIGRRTMFLRSLEAERKLIEKFDTYWEDVDLDQHLRKIYDLEIREQSRLWNIEFAKSADRSALDLLEIEEQVNLLDYELGLDIFKRLKAEGAKRTIEEPLRIPYDSANVYYEFDAEYWNDELHSYKYFINSRCFEMEGGK
jgi:tetratricopeptide (TPR) repeat protein